MKKFILISVFLLVYCIPLSSDPLKIGRVSINVEKTVNRLKPIAEYIVNQVPEAGFTSAQVVVVKQVDELIAMARAGEIDWITESCYTSALLIHKSNMVPILVRHRKGHRSYGSVMVVSPGIDHWTDLIGKKIAAEDSGSFSGYFLIYRELIQKNLPLKFLENPRQASDSNHVNLVFSGDEENSVAWFKMNLAQAAIFSDLDYSNPELIPDTVKKKMTVFYQSEKYPRALELLSANLSLKIRDAIKVELFKLGEKKDHPLLKTYGRSTGFSELSSKQHEQLKSIYTFAEKNPL